MHPSRQQKPDASHLQAGGRHNFITRCGPLDVVPTIGRELSYEDVLPHTVEIEIGDGVRVRVLDLETIIVVKEELGGEKGFPVLPLLRPTLAEKQRR